MDAIKFVQEQLANKSEHPSFRPGDTIAVSLRIKEGEKERIQVYRGDVIQIKGHGATKTFTVRKMSNGVLKRGKVRRAKLYYLRDLVGKKARIKERKFIKK